MKNLIPLLFSLLFITGCSTTAYFYPVSGPISESAPVPAIEAKADGIMGNTGNISLTLPSGEVLKGRWSVIAPMSVNYSQSSVSATATNGMSSVWTQVYGNGLTIRNKPGVNRGEAFLTGNLGSTMQMEFYTGSGTANGFGVAKDNKGNIYKVIF